jgi:poly(3-hydroxybutyrate) depolymerase
MKRTFRLFITILFLFSLALPAKAQFQLPECKTYEFAKRDSALYLDVYKPVNPREDKAAVISLFGGGFFSGARNNREMKQVAQALLERGFTVISIDYRLGFQDKEMVASHSKLFKLTELFQYCIDIATEDCAAAVAWTCANAGMLDIDPSRIILTGSSAGAVSVLQMDYCRANSLEQASVLPEGWKPAAVIPYSGGIMCHKRELKYKTDPAPTMLMHGKKDKIVNYKSFGLPLSSKLFGSKKVNKAMNRQDIPHWFISFEDVGHEVAIWLPGSTDLFCSFVDMALAGRTTTLEADITDSDLKPAKWAQMGILQLYGGGGPRKR